MTLLLYLYSKKAKMEYNEVIRSRESVRSYDPGLPLNPEMIKRIIDAGRVAPSACNNQPWKFLVVSSPEMLEKVKACYHREWFKRAPHILVVKGYRDQSWKRAYDGHNSIETDLAIAMTHIILSAANEGVGTCWIANFDPYILRQALSLKENEVVFGITPLGFPEKGYQLSSKKRKPAEEIVEFL